MTARRHHSSSVSDGDHPSGATLPSGVAAPSRTPSVTSTLLRSGGRHPIPRAFRGRLTQSTLSDKSMQDLDNVFLRFIVGAATSRPMPRQDGVGLAGTPTSKAREVGPRHRRGQRETAGPSAQAVDGGPRASAAQADPCSLSAVRREEQSNRALPARARRAAPHETGRFRRSD